MKVFATLAAITASTLIASQCLAQDSGEEGDPGLPGVSAENMVAKVLIGQFYLAGDNSTNRYQTFASNSNYRSYRVLAPKPFNFLGLTNASANNISQQISSVGVVGTEQCFAYVANNAFAVINIDVYCEISAIGKPPSIGNSKSTITLGGATATMNLASGEKKNRNDAPVQFYKTNVMPGDYSEKSGSWKIELNTNP
jgi:hypothetical protein